MCWWQLWCKLKESFGAVFDESGRYRYRLWRRWDPSLPKLCVVMLNPSTADATVNDPTITRCMNLASSWGYGGLEVVNLFAYRSTSPRGLWRAEDPVGPHNDEHIKRALAHCSACLLAWGNLPSSRLERARNVLKMAASGKKLFCLGMTKMQQPRHPLYLTSDVALEPVTLNASSEGINFNWADSLASLPLEAERSQL
jgi:hypothetical protein